MIRSLWIAKTGLEAQQTNMDVISNNLANVNTNGFKRQRAVFQDLLYQTMRQPGAQASEQTPMSLSKAKASSRCSCLTAAPRTPVTDISIKMKTVSW